MCIYVCIYIYIYMYAYIYIYIERERERDTYSPDWPAVSPKGEKGSAAEAPAHTCGRWAARGLPQRC